MKKIIFSLFILITVTTLTSFYPAPEVAVIKKPVQTIIIDAGHGGRDPGCRGSYSYEKDISLDIALKLGKIMEEEFPDVKVLYTRTTDIYPPNRSRAEFANNNKGDLYISIHVNSMPKKKHQKFAGYKTEVYYTGKGKKRKKHTRRIPKYTTYYTIPPTHGTETYIWAADRTDEKGDFVGERMTDEVSDSNDYVPDINDPEFKAKSLLWTKRFFDKSLLLAEMVEKEFVKEGRPSHGVKQRNEEGIWVLQATAMPSILVETGFITNRADEDYLNSKKGQLEIANNIMNAVRQYRLAVESATGTSKKTLSKQIKQPAPQPLAKRK
jgi:N-acetylmuramoyl-L-alanine amidase